MGASSRCCRSMPRCASCPVLLAARARGRVMREADDALVTEVFSGTATRELPPCVRDALAVLDEKRRSDVLLPHAERDGGGVSDRATAVACAMRQGLLE